MPRDRYDDRDDFEDRDRPRRRDDDYDDRPRRRQRDDDYDRPAARGGNGFAVASLILGLVSICLGPITGVIGAILGFVGVSKPTGKGMATTGIVLNLLFSLIGTAGIIIGFMRTGEAAARMQSSNNLMQMGMASHNHEWANGALPPPYVKRPGDPQGVEPTDLNDRLGWRVTILPYLEQDSLYKQFDLSQPWNSSRNQPLSSTVVKPYTDPDARTDPTTRYRCFYDNGAVFDTKQTVTLTSITDGTSNTILYIEGGEKVTWTRFQEYKFDPNGPLPPLGHPKRDVIQAVMADGSVHSIRKTISPTTLKAAITRNGNEVLGDDW